MKTTPLPSELISYGRRTAQWAERHPNKACLIFVPVDGKHIILSWSQVAQRSNQVAQLLVQARACNHPAQIEGRGLNQRA